MKVRKKSAADSLKDTIAAFGAMVQREAEALATTAVESFKRNYRRKGAKRKPAARSAKRTTGAARKIAATTVGKAKAAVKRSLKPRTAARTATGTRKPIGKSRRRKSA